MGNYKNIKFNNTTEDMKRWSKTFPPLDADAVVKSSYKKHEDYYLELQLVSGFMNSNPFVNATVREYDHNEKNFEYVGVQKEEELLNSVFKSKIEKFKEKYL